MKKFGTMLLLVGACIGALILPFTNMGQPRGLPDLDQLLFVPSQYPVGEWDPAGLEVEDVYFQSSDDTRIHGWYLASAKARLAILILHGNAGNVATRTEEMRYFQNRGDANVLIFDYRGYGRSGGRPTVTGVVEDALAARRKLGELADVSTSEVVLIGESIGGAVALELAVMEPPRGLVLQSTFSSLKELAAIHYPQYALSIPIDAYDSATAIQQYQGPLLQSHGSEDQIIPIALGRRLYENAGEDKRFLAIPGAGHSDWQTAGYYAALDHFLQEMVDEQSAR